MILKSILLATLYKYKFSSSTIHTEEGDLQATNVYSH